MSRGIRPALVCLIEQICGGACGWLVRGQPRRAGGRSVGSGRTACGRAVARPQAVRVLSTRCAKAHRPRVRPHHAPLNVGVMQASGTLPNLYVGPVPRRTLFSIQRTLVQHSAYFGSAFGVPRDIDTSSPAIDTRQPSLLSSVRAWRHAFRLMLWVLFDFASGP